MDTGNRVCFRRDHSCPSVQDGPIGEEEISKLRAWKLDMVDDLTEASVEFIAEQLCNLNADSAKSREVQEAIKRRLIGAWADWVLALLGEDTEGPVLVDEETRLAFLKRKFGE